MVSFLLFLVITEAVRNETAAVGCLELTGNSFRVLSRIFGLADGDVLISAARWAFYCLDIALQNQPRRLREVFCFIEFTPTYYCFQGSFSIGEEKSQRTGRKSS